MCVTTGTGEAKNRAFWAVMAAPPVSSVSRAAPGDHRDEAEEDQAGGHGPLGAAADTGDGGAAGVCCHGVVLGWDGWRRWYMNRAVYGVHLMRPR